MCVLVALGPGDPRYLHTRSYTQSLARYEAIIFSYSVLPVDLPVTFVSIKNTLSLSPFVFRTTVRSDVEERVAEERLA